MSDEFNEVMEHMRSAVATSTGRTTFVTQALGRPDAPYCLIRLLGHHGKEDSVVSSLDLQVDGFGRSWRDSLWMTDRAAASIRTMALPPGVGSCLTVGKSSPVPLEADEGVLGVGQRLNVRMTRAAP